jgi:hypothetical protein
VNFATTGQLLIIYSAFTKQLRNNGNAIFTLRDFKKAMDNLEGRSGIIRVFLLSLVSPRNW